MIVKNILKEVKFHMKSEPLSSAGQGEGNGKGRKLETISTGHRQRELVLLASGLSRSWESLELKNRLKRLGIVTSTWEMKKHAWCSSIHITLM